MAAERQVNIIVNFLANGLEKLTTQLKGLNTEMAALRGETSKTRTQVSGLGKDVGNASKGLDTYSKNANKARTSSEKLNNSSKKAKGGFANFGKQLVNTAAFLLRFAAVTAIFSAITFAIVGSAKAAAEFEAALKDLQAIANISNSELEKLSKNALEVAGSTRFTAGEIVALNKALARLGFSTEEILQSTEAMARFAEATGESGEAVAEFVGKQLRAFNVTAAETLRLTNEYTVAINNSALTLEALATSSQYAASISSALGVSIKEQNALLATLADNGLTASRAGTGLRKILLELGADAGSLVPILDELAESNISVSDAEELVGDRAAGALLALVRQRDSIEDLIEKQNTLSATFIASARQNATFKGQIDALSAATDQLLIRFGNWVTKTEIILKLIERLGGGETIRGFNVIDEIGLSSEDIDKVRENLSKIDTELIPISDARNRYGFKILDQDVIDFGKSLGLTGEQALDLAELAKKSDKNLRAFVNTLKDFSEEAEAQESITTSVTKATEGYRLEISDLTKQFNEEGLTFQEANELFEKRDEIYRRIGDSIDFYEQKLSKLGLEEDEERARTQAIIASLEGYQQTVVNVGKTVEKIDPTAVFFTPEGIKEAEQAAIDMQKVLKDFFGMIDADVDSGLLRGDEISDKINNEYFPAISKALREGSISISQAEELREAGRELLGTLLTGDEKGLSKEFLTQQFGKFFKDINAIAFDAVQRRLDAEQAAVDARYSFEEDRLNSLLQANIVSQEQYERQRLRLEKERVAKTNEIERKRFNADKANSLSELAIETAISLIRAETTPERILIAALSASQAAIVASQKFVPTKFKKGGMIEGASHEQGGVPFTVNGRAGFEAEGGEFIVNKKATEAFLPMLERINSFGSSSIPAQRQVFANGGVVPQGGGRTDDLLEQLVSQSSQRTIAYISEEQLISRNNTRITNDIRKRL